MSRNTFWNYFWTRTANSYRMFLRKYSVFIVVIFLGIFTAKMVISGAPVFFAHFDKNFMNSVIMQLELENNSDDASKGHVKFADQKIILHHYALVYVPLITSYGVTNSFIDHSRRYVDPYHPSVPTPPPNFS